MATQLSHDTLISALEAKFDYLTARAVAGEVLDKAGVKKSDAYDSGAAQRIAQAVESLVPAYKQKSILERIAVSGAVSAAGPAAAPESKKPAKAEAPVEAAPVTAAPVTAAADSGAADSGAADAAPAAEGDAAAAEAHEGKAEKKKKKD
ncbi:MAG: hypothetical protein EXR79_07490 [Myxococcales bacterium]|nr:hypothetical protein [Myxococcales bacterium]